MDITREKRKATSQISARDYWREKKREYRKRKRRGEDRERGIGEGIVY